MEETNLELALRDMARRLVVLVDQVGQGELVDTSILQKLNEVSEFVYLKHQAGQPIENDEIELMNDLLCLLEMRTTLFYGSIK